MGSSEVSSAPEDDAAGTLPSALTSAGSDSSMSPLEDMWNSDPFHVKRALGNGEFIHVYPKIVLYM